MIQYEKLARRFEVLDNIENLMESMLDMETAVKEEKIETEDEDIIILSNRVKELQKQVDKIMNNE